MLDVRVVGDVPTRAVGLRVAVNEDGFFVEERGSEGNVTGDSGFSYAAFLDVKGNLSHTHR